MKGVEFHTSKPGEMMAGAFWLAARLCEEAGVCLNDPQGNRVQIHAAAWHVDDGLQVRDADGRLYRLEVKARLVLAASDDRFHEQETGESGA